MEEREGGRRESETMHLIMRRRAGGRCPARRGGRGRQPRLGASTACLSTILWPHLRRGWDAVCRADAAVRRSFRFPEYAGKRNPVTQQLAEEAGRGWPQEDGGSWKTALYPELFPRGDPGGCHTPGRWRVLVATETWNVKDIYLQKFQCLDP